MLMGVEEMRRTSTTESARPLQRKGRTIAAEALPRRAAEFPAGTALARAAAEFLAAAAEDRARRSRRARWRRRWPAIM